jgi:hypothetical protein
MDDDHLTRIAKVVGHRTSMKPGNHLAQRRRAVLGRRQYKGSLPVTTARPTALPESEGSPGALGEGVRPVAGKLLKLSNGLFLMCPTAGHAHRCGSEPGVRRGEAGQ